MYLWGDPDASVEFCEDKYVESYWIGEYYNTLSSLFYIVIATPFLYTKISHIAWCIVGIGVGSILLHGTLRYYGQWVDEVCMLLTCFQTIKYLRPQVSNIFQIALLGMYFYLSHIYIIFIGVFFALKIYLLYATFIGSGSLWGSLYIIFFLLGFLCWCLDKFSCPYTQHLYLHAWWHVLTSMSILFGLLELRNYKVKK